MKFFGWEWKAKAKPTMATRLLIPWYANGTLDAAGRQQVEDLLQSDPQAQQELAQWNALREAARREAATDQAATSQPLLRIHRGLLAQVRQAPPRRRNDRALEWIGATVFTLLALVFLWFTIQPGMLLQWSVEGDSLSRYRIYRAPAGTQEFQLVDEILTRTDERQISYVDTLLFPGRAYVYYIEGVGRPDVSAYVQATAESTLKVLPGQVAVIFISLLCGLSGAMCIQALNVPGWRRSGSHFV